MGKSRNKKKKSTNANAQTAGAGFLDVDPARVRFQYSKIRPYFSGCGRSVLDTLESIRRGELKPEDLPPIQVIVGPDENDGLGPWYFSLNNRRLYVLKRCREEGLLKNDKILVRVREAKSAKEAERYSLKNCAVEAKFMRESAPNSNDLGTNMKSIDGIENDLGNIHIEESNVIETVDSNNENEIGDMVNVETEHNDEKESDDSSVDSEEVQASRQPYKNPFSLGDDSSDSDSDSD